MREKAQKYIAEKTANTAPAEIRTRPRPKIDINEVLKNKKVYVMAACGKAMATICALFKEIGFKVRGSDSVCFPPMRDVLMAATDEYHDGFSPNNLRDGELVVVGNAIACDNLEFLEIQKRGLPHISVSEAVGNFFIGNKKSLVVAGTHGKTTTTGLLAHVIEHANKNPGYMIGGVITNNEKSYSIGNGGDYFISEGDEYNSALFDRGPKFLHYKPYAAIITSVEYDHADLYLTMDDYKMAFQLLAEEVSSLLVLEGDKGSTDYLKKYTDKKILTYGFSEKNDVRAENIVINHEKDCQEFDLVVNGKKLIRMETKLFGKYNIENILAVCAVALNEGVQAEILKEGVSTFTGMKRRQELVYKTDDVVVIDDYAHHPTAVTLTLAGIKERYPNRRIVALFEPKSATSRSHLFEKPYADAFSPLADIIMFHIPALTTENPANFISGSNLNKYFLEGGKTQEQVYMFEGKSIDVFYEQFKKLVRKGDVVVVMASFNFGNIVEKIQKVGIKF